VGGGCSRIFPEEYYAVKQGGVVYGDGKMLPPAFRVNPINSRVIRCGNEGRGNGAGLVCKCVGASVRREGVNECNRLFTAATQFPGTQNGNPG
jgi:hypothetical protein